MPENSRKSSVNMARQRPLMMHMGLAAASIAEPHFRNREIMDDAFWQRPAGKAVSASMEKVIDGFKKYQLHPYARVLTRQSVVWSSGQTRLIWHAAKSRVPKARILVMPSMINGPEILDILPDVSLLRWLAGQGFDVYLLEWGDLRLDPDLKNLDTAFQKKIKPMLEYLQEDSELPLYGMGYCMGGLFLAAAEVLEPAAFKGLCFVASPWDFKVGAKNAFPEAVQRWAAGGLERVRQMDYMPADWLQMIFAGVDPGLIARKFSAFANMKQTGAPAELFVAVEDWVNGGADLPAGIIHDCVKSWYIDNKPFKGTWSVAGKTVSAKKIEKPSLVIVPGRDRIVPPVSAKALYRQLPNVWLLEPDCGHISMMVSSKAKAMVWEPIREWLLDDLKLQRSKTKRRKPLK
jgi:polyhydroxyalkanoate synthase